VRIAIVGFGTVGRWVASALVSQGCALRDRCGTSIEVVALANGRDGFVFADDGIDLPSALEASAAGQSLTELAGVRAWPSAVEGLREIDIDLLVETSASPMANGEPGLTHIREALQRGTSVVTSNKWPVALRGVELSALARDRHVAFRAESTVMSGTPLLGPLTEGLAGATPLSVRGVVNATVNSILTTMRSGADYETALTDAQEAGLAEPEASADVDGHDAVAKVMILSALVFGRQLAVGDVARRGVSELTNDETMALAAGRCVREVASLDFSEPGGEGEVRASVEPEVVEAGDPLSEIGGATNTVVCRADPLGEVRVAGPGAGPALAGQGVLSDLIRVAGRPIL